ncbi:polyadenylation and cleavage factor homolog 4-like [Gastrolobium bilobum]|uniref:polyadenylation and cleavage factor homolog 4-like n=1 Tax=Gastrolobium bilobum TaxID=150636 RepID=UPI002AB0BA74|nr:polyadenylation and cleavage factor homolog 4-like [Gastrolobium bilobum]
MDMESTRRSLDRSREPGAKKLRLIDELDRGSNPTARPFPQRQQPGSGVVTTTVASARFRTNDRNSESSDLGRGGEYQPQPPPHQELVIQYRTALAELTFNSKPIITNLTIIAGENQSAAKAIAGTVCANILEVPSEQKLPSLYLLDSIVKNIGRDYIKYFASRLPEVFCKAYRQVDPNVHSSMRHLFGTWKGVFPPQTLQMIERELGFTPAVNGSASASATLRSDSQSQRPPHSIHVNPKYLERQRLQQTSRTKGVANDMTGAILNSNEDSERPERALSAARPWLDPRVNMQNNQRTQRNAFNDSIPEKSIGGTYGGDVAETTSGQRNGFSLKHGFSNHEAPKSMNLDAPRQPTQNLTNIRSNVMSNNWKNSEEEEFTWREMNSGLTDHGASSVSNNLSADPWMADDENLEGEDHLQITDPFGAKADREISTVKKQLPAFGGHSSLTWQLQKQHSFDKLNLKPGHPEGFVSTPDGLPGNTNSSTVRMGNRSFMPNATIGMVKFMGQQFDSEGAESPSGQSPLRQQSPSLPVTMHQQPHSMGKFSEHDRPQILKTSQSLGGMQSQYIRDLSPTLPPNVQVGNLRRSQEKDLPGPLSSVTSFQSGLQQQRLGPSKTGVTIKTKKPPQSKVSSARETSEQSTSSLSAADVKSGIFPKKSITSSLPTTSSLDARNLPSQSRIRPTKSGGPSPTTLISSGSAVASPSSLGPLNDDSSTLPKIPQGKAGQPQRTSTPANVSSASAPSSNATNNNTLNPIANLLSSLVAKGLISAETESVTVVPSEMLMQSEDETESITPSCSLPVASVSGSAAVPVPSSGDKVDDVGKSSLALLQSTSTEVRNLIGFDFKPDIIRELHPPVIRGLLDDLPHHCTICGIRLKKQEQFDRHLEWHATREREQNGLIRASRRWYAKSKDWIAGRAGDLSEFEFTDSVDVYDEKTGGSQLDTMVPADENQCLCVLCGELFEDVYCQERDEWMFKGAVYLNNSDRNSEIESRNVGPIIHARCLTENSISSVTNTEHD